MNFGTLVKVFDTAVALGSAAGRMRGSAQSQASSGTAGTATIESQAPSPGVRGYLETRLTNVLVVALREAFDRDRARLELERADLEEQRGRAARALQMELWRQAADRELGRLRLVAGMALGGWIASVVVLVMRLDTASLAARVVMAIAWVLLLGALGTAITAQGRVTVSVDATGPADAGRGGLAAMSLLLAGLALAAGSLLF